MKKSVKRKLKKIFNVYNLAIVGCVVMIAISLVILIEPDFSSFKKTNDNKTDQVSSQDKNINTEEDDEIDPNDVKIVEAKNSGEEISEKDAQKLAKSQFEELGENKLKVEDLEVLKIKREGEEYFYISSTKNTVEINKKTGKITRINSVKVE